MKKSKRHYGGISKLSEEDKEYLKSVYHSGISHEEKMSILTKRFKRKARTIRAWWLKLGLTAGFTRLPRDLKKASENYIDDDADILIVTTAQNKTLTNRHCLQNIIAYKKFIEDTYDLRVQLAIIPSRYRNPTSPVETDQRRADLWWDDDVRPYLIYGKYHFGDVLISSDSRVIPTAEKPLSGYEALSAENHLVLGHPRIHQMPNPRFKGERLRYMCTTGMITYKNYSHSKAGDKGFIHHSYGFVILEKKEDGVCYYPRIVHMETDGTFIDCWHRVERGEVTREQSSLGYILGDIHYKELNQQKIRKSKDVCKRINPNVVIMHDLYDASNINHHERKDLYIRKKKIREGNYRIDEEVKDTIQFAIDFKADVGTEVKVVQSNHDDFLDKHINDFDWKKDLHNSEVYLEYARIQQTEDIENYGNLFGYLLTKATHGSIQYIKANEGFKIGSYECGYHGDAGANGARGSINGFKRLNVKMICGDKHTPCIMDGLMTVGISCEAWQYYNSNGLSSWGYADAIVHNNGKRQLICFDDDDYEFTLLK